ncbi:hypothetical protein, partial [Tolypothrix sp. VBCCA 56010]|uniref:hypothetical protein n=1 Tax=Tolypothrix sp. VBCCA 56010 TaxID=3137731 RepID=UPI003D7CCA84
QPSPEDVKNGKVAAFEADINQRRTHLLRAQAWLSKPPSDRDYYPGNATTESEYLLQAIPILTKQLEALKVEPIRQDKEYDLALRKYVIARTKIEPVLERFLEAQSQYLEVLAEFKAAIA